MLDSWPRRLKGCGWFVADLFVHISFSLGVWILSDLPSAWAAWKWKRARRKAKAIRERERRGN